MPVGTVRPLSSTDSFDALSVLYKSGEEGQLSDAALKDVIG